MVTALYSLVRYINRMIEIIVTLDLGISLAKALSFRFSADNGVWEELQGVDNVQAAQGKHRSQGYLLCSVHIDTPDERHRQAKQHYIGDNIWYWTSQQVPTERYSAFVCRGVWKTTDCSDKNLDQNYKSAN